MTKLAGVRPNQMTVDPLTFFTRLMQVQQSKSPFIDDGVKMFDIACGEAMADDGGRFDPSA